MNKFIWDVVTGIIIGAVAFIGGALIATAAVTTVTVLEPTGVTASVACNNENFDHSTRCQSPVDHNTFRMLGPGHFDGYLLSGVYFEQYPVAKTFSKFVAEDAFWYIDNHGRFDAASDIQALSIHLTRQ